jgi:hypothetical protein
MERSAISRDKQPVLRAAPAASFLIAAISALAALNYPAAAAKLEVLHEFTGPDGSDPQGGLTVDPNTGTLYGTAFYGGNGYGTVFSLTRPTHGKRNWKYEIIHTFEGSFDGSNPATGLAISPSGDFLWGTTLKGSSFCGGSCGTIFRLAKEVFGHGWVKETVHQFTGESFDGILPNSAPVIDSQTAYLYGTTSSSTSSTIYRMLLGDNSFSVLYNAEMKIGEYVGYHPQGVALAGDGTIYGTAADGEFAGTIFRIDLDGVGKILHRFGGPDGLYPLGPPLLSAEALYGTTWEGGAPGDCPGGPGCGTVWRMLPSGREKVLHSFAFFRHPRDGQTPLSPLVLDPLTGTLYGTTYNGGTGTVCGGNGGSCGTIYSVDRQGGHYQVLWEFPHGGPAAPEGQLVFHDGALYGTSYDGGKPCSDQHYLGCGTVWKLTP